MSRYVALLRGINVGGKNLIKMTDLRACFEEQGFLDVVTYIQSGNVIFEAERAPAAELTRRIETVLGESFGYRASVVLRSHAQLRRIVEQAPKGFGDDPARYLYDVLFLKPPLTSTVAMKSVLTREGVDRAYAGTGVLYFARLASRAAQSRLNRIASEPIYQSMTIRNWNTTTKLLKLMDGR
ncbi:MAG TPA: DUF1697 domain-containing protein [Actinomycetota bacterium]|nr:DUF1697 domain-containing protein [Actinomycetota bacterium]